MFKNSTKNRFIKEMNLLMGNIKEMEDYDLNLVFMKAFYKFLHGMDESNLAIQVLKKVKGLTMDNKNFEEYMKCLETLGTIYLKVSNYEDAILQFKELLEFAWECGSFKTELNCYKQIGKANFYLGDLERAQYYENRGTLGMVENDNSIIK